MSLSAPRQLYETGVASVDTEARVELGAVGSVDNGDQWRYVGTGSSAVVANSLVVAGARVAAHQNIVVANGVAVGGRSLTVTLGATASTQDQYAQGYLEVVSGTGAGTVFSVSGNSATVASGVATVVLAQPATVALDATSHVNLVANDYANVQNSATASEVLGVALTAIPANSWGWIKTRGEVLVTASAAVSQGAAIQQDTTNAGDVVTATSATYQVGQAKAALAASGLLSARITVDA